MKELRWEKWDRRFLNLAAHISTWSKDPSTKVGAVLVNELQQVVGMGYNGFARGVVDTDERLNN
jgi:dCMP deaminase